MWVLVYSALEKNILGDIINSSPVWVGYPANTRYQRTWRDKHGAGTGNEDGYREFANDNYSRVNAVYAGSMMVSCMLSVVDTMMPIVSLI